MNSIDGRTKSFYERNKTMENISKIGFIGVGVMGRSMVRNLMKKGGRRKMVRYRRGVRGRQGLRDHDRRLPEGCGRGLFR